MAWETPVARLKLFFVKVHGVRQVDVVARDDLVLGGDDGGLAVRLVLLAAVAVARGAPTGRSRGTCV